VRTIKAKEIKRYVLVGVAFLLAAVIFLPGRAMAPPSPYKSLLPLILLTR
jgi:hypothetical protein